MVRNKEMKDFISTPLAPLIGGVLTHIIWEPIQVFCSYVPGVSRWVGLRPTPNPIKNKEKFLKILLAFFIFITISAQTFAADLTATVSTNQVGVGDIFSLKLSLSDAKEKSSPDTSQLEKDFKVLGQTQFSNISIINGKTTSLKGWNYTLLAKREGECLIPSVSVKTDKGVITSAPIYLTVNKKSKSSADTENKTASIETLVSKNSPYTNESIILTVRISGNQGVYDLQLEPLNVPGVLLEKMDDQQNYRRIVNGKEVSIIEVKYILTPLKEGEIRIPPAILRGKIRVANKRNSNDPFSIFDDDSFFAGSVFGKYKDFTASSNEINLKVKAPAVKITHWLPLQSLSISEDWDNNAKFKEGEPIYRTITLKAKGIAGNQLPSIKDKLGTDDFKIYTDNPETGQKISAGEELLTGWKKETYTLIPQKSGNLTLPEIRIPWWNVEKDQIDYAVLPAKTIKVAAAEIIHKNINTPVQQDENTIKSVSPPVEKIQESNTNSVPAGHNDILYAIIGILALLVIVMALCIAYLFRKMALLPQREAISDVKEDKKEVVALPAIDSINDVRELAKYVQIYAHKYWNMKSGLTLQEILSNLPAQIPDAKKMFKQLDAAIYAGKGIDIENWKQEWKVLTEKIKAGKPNKPPKKDNFMPLNPK